MKIPKLLTDYSSTEKQKTDKKKSKTKKEAIDKSKWPALFLPKKWNELL